MEWGSLCTLLPPVCGVRWLVYYITTWMWSVVACILLYHLNVSAVVCAFFYQLFKPHSALSFFFIYYYYYHYYNHFFFYFPGWAWQQCQDLCRDVTLLWLSLIHWQSCTPGVWIPPPLCTHVTYIPRGFLSWRDNLFSTWTFQSAAAWVTW